MMPRPCVNEIERIYYYKILMQKKSPQGAARKSNTPADRLGNSPCSCIVSENYNERKYHE